MGNTPTKSPHPQSEDGSHADHFNIEEAPADVLADMKAEAIITTPKKRHKFDIQWDENLNSLREYKADHGDCSVPIMSKIYGKLGKVCAVTSALPCAFNFALTSIFFKWCENQKYSYGRGKLSQDRIDRLREVGFVFEANVPRSPQKKFPSYDKLKATRIEELKVCAHLTSACVAFQ